MPINMTVSRVDRTITTVATGDVTLQDLIDFFREIVESGSLEYRKIVDVAAARPIFNTQELTAFSDGVRTARGDQFGGTLAIVANPHDELAQLFARLAGDVCPRKVFQSIHEARRWLAADTTSPP